MAEFIKKFANPAAADQYAIKDIPFITSIGATGPQNLVCNEEGKKLVSVGGIIEVQSAGPTIEMVDLGLTSGNLWAAHNIGANPGLTPESYYGAYYAWGEVETKSDYKWSTYKYCTSNYDPAWGKGSITKYTDTDGKTELETEDNIVIATYGSNYAMPTVIEVQELLDETDNELVTDYNGISGLNGRKFMKKSDHSVFIFIPSAGSFGNTSVSDAGNICYLWTSSRYSDPARSASVLFFFSNTIYANYCNRYFGYPVRAIQRVS